MTLVDPDIEATYHTLIARGVRFKHPVTAMPWGTKATWFTDLDGNEFLLVAEWQRFGPPGPFGSEHGATREQGQ